MNMSKLPEKGYIVLEDGKIFEGVILSMPENMTVGEIVFNTSMSGYQEILTDPSYANQMIVMTYPLIGNYGTNSSNEESSKIFAKALIAREICQSPENYQIQSNLLDYAKDHQLCVMEEVDTRALTLYLRERGTMKAAIVSDINDSKKIISKIEETNLNETTKIVSTPRPYTLTPPYGIVKHRIALLDFGVKKNIIHSLLRRQCQVTVLPHDATFETIKSLKPHGVLLSNGPGDPKEHSHRIETIQKIINAYPTFGICMGHQLLSLALGGDTKKMKFGHRGANHPVIDLKNNKMVLTSQNHGYMTVAKSLDTTKINLRFLHNNDESIEGFEHKELPILSVQFHPEANPGPQESHYLFDEFINMMKENL